MLSRMRYFESINLFIGVILSHISPKAFPKECCYLWCLSMIQVISLSSWWKKFFISSVLSIITCFRSGRILPQFWEVFHKPTTSLFVFCWFSNDSVITFLEGCFPSSFVAEVGIFFSILLFQWSTSILSYGGIVMLLFSLIISNCEDRVLFLLIHLTGVLCYLFKLFSSYQVLHLFSTGVLSEFDLPWSLFISFQPEWFQFLLLHCTRHS